MSDDLPYKAEYAKSGRASCKSCKSTIAQASLRLARMVQVSYTIYRKVVYDLRASGQFETKKMKYEIDESYAFLLLIFNKSCIIFIHHVISNFLASN